MATATKKKKAKKKKAKKKKARKKKAPPTPPAPGRYWLEVQVSPTEWAPAFSSPVAGLAAAEKHQWPEQLEAEIKRLYDADTGVHEVRDLGLPVRGRCEVPAQGPGGSLYSDLFVSAPQRPDMPQPVCTDCGKRMDWQLSLRLRHLRCETAEEDALPPGELTPAAAPAPAEQLQEEPDPEDIDLDDVDESFLDEEDLEELKALRAAEALED